MDKTCLDKDKTFMKKVIGLECDNPPWPAQLVIYVQITLCGYL